MFYFDPYYDNYCIDNIPNFVYDKQSCVNKVFINFANESIKRRDDDLHVPILKYFDCFEEQGLLNIENTT